MAVDANSIPAPARPLLPLVPFVFRPVPPVDEPRSAVELLDEIRRAIEAQESCHRDTPTLLTASAALPVSGDVKSATVADIRHGVVFDPCELPSVGNLPAHQSVSQIDTLGEARAIHLRRQLAEAAEHGVALLDALGLPRLVTADSELIDREAVAEALDVVIDHLDALDAPDEDREPYLAGYYNAASDPTGEGEPSEDDEDDGTTEPNLGAPERHPYAWTMTDWFYRPAEGKRLMRYRCHESQVSWAQGSRDDREADPHDGPIDEDDLDDDGLSKGEGDGADEEPWLASPIGDGDQRHWTQGGSRDHEDVTEGDGQPAADWYARPIGPLRPHVIGYDHDRDMRVLARRADDVRRRLRPGPSRPDPDTVIPIGPGVVWWAGPTL